MKPLFTLAAAMPGHVLQWIEGEANKFDGLQNYDDKKRPMGVAGCVRGGCFGTWSPRWGEKLDTPMVSLPFFIGQKLAAHGDLHPVSFRIFYFLDFHGEIDGAHYPVPKFLVN